MNCQTLAINRGVGRSLRLRLPKYSVQLQKSHVHILKIPYNHLPYVKFKDGIPEKKNRKIQLWEIAAGYGRVWSTTESKSVLPKVSFFTKVPPNEVWVMTRGGKYHRSLRDGIFFIAPFIDEVKALRSPYNMANGIFAACTTADGMKVDAYCVLYFRWTDYEKSAFYIDEERGDCDAETSLQYITLEALANEVLNHKFTGDGKVDPEVEKKILQKIQEKHAAYTPLYGMQVLSVELRGVWNQSEEVPLKVYSLEPEAPRPDIQQSLLPNDYWSEVLEPMPFKRYTYGSEKMIETPAVTSLEWAIPSPPDYHHYNMPPVILMDPEEFKKKGGRLVI